MAVIHVENGEMSGNLCTESWEGPASMCSAPSRRVRFPNACPQEGQWRISL